MIVKPLSRVVMAGVAVFLFVFVSVLGGASLTKDEVFTNLVSSGDLGLDLRMDFVMANPSMQDLEFFSGNITYSFPINATANKTFLTCDSRFLVSVDRTVKDDVLCLVNATCKASDCGNGSSKLVLNWSVCPSTTSWNEVVSLSRVNVSAGRQVLVSGGCRFSQFTPDAYSLDVVPGAFDVKQTSWVLFNSSGYQQRYNLTIKNSDSANHSFEVMNFSLAGTTCSFDPNSTRIVDQSNNQTVNFTWVNQSSTSDVLFVTNTTVPGNTVTYLNYWLYCNSTGAAMGNFTLGDGSILDYEDCESDNATLGAKFNTTTQSTITNNGSDVVVGQKSCYFRCDASCASDLLMKVRTPGFGVQDNNIITMSLFLKYSRGYFPDNTEQTNIAPDNANSGMGAIRYLLCGTGIAPNNGSCYYDGAAWQNIHNGVGGSASDDPLKTTDIVINTSAAPVTNSYDVWANGSTLVVNDGGALVGIGTISTWKLSKTTAASKPGNITFDNVVICRNECHQFPIQGVVVLSSAKNLANSGPSLSSLNIYGVEAGVTRQFVFSNGSLFANVTYSDPDGDPGNVSFYWSKNGVLAYWENFTVSSGMVVNASLGEGNFTHGDLVNLTVTARDSQGFNATNVTSPTSNVTNVPPVVGNIGVVGLENGVDVGYVFSNGSLRSNVTYTDADGDPANVTFVWYRNGTRVHVENFTVASGMVVNATLAGTNYSHFDIINVTVWVVDTYANSTNRTFNLVNVSNSIPLVVAVGSMTANWSFFSTGIPVLVFNATDPDGDDGGNRDNLSYQVQVADTVGFTNILRNLTNQTNRTQPYSVFPNGLLYWRVNVTDGWNSTLMGNYSVFVVDTLAPSILNGGVNLSGNMSPSGVAGFVSNVSVNISDSYNVSLVLFNVSWPNLSVTTHVGVLNGSTQEYMFNFSSSSLIEGNYTVFVVANDSVNQVNRSVNFTFVVNDQQGPVLANITVGNNGSLNVPHNISLDVSDFNLTNGIVLVNVTVPNGTVVNFTLLAALGASPKYYLALNFTSFGLYSFFVVANDSENQVSVSSNSTFRVGDALNPSVTNLSTNATNVNRTPLGSIVVSVNVTDDTNVSVVLANITWPNLSNSLAQLMVINVSTNTSYFLVFNDTLIEGLYNVTVMVNDTSNNVNMSVVTNFSVLDQEAPVFANITVGNNGSIAFPHNVSVDVVDFNVSVVYLNLTTPVSSLNYSLVRSGSPGFFVELNETASGGYSAVLVANDTKNNRTVSIVFSWSIPALSPSGGGGGGGGVGVAGLQPLAFANLSNAELKCAVMGLKLSEVNGSKYCVPVTTAVVNFNQDRQRLVVIGGITLALVGFFVVSKRKGKRERKRRDE